MSKVSSTNGTELPIIEPSEIDPCMEINQEKRNVFLRLRNDACNRWKLSHKVFYVGVAMFVLLVILFIVVITLGATWPHIPHSQQYPVCNDSECLRAAAQIQESMNNSASPCSDLWTWACGNWLKAYPLPKDKSIWNQKQQLVKQEAAKIRDLITTLNLPLSTGTVEWKLKHLYEACLDVDTVKIDEARPLTNIISELGGWYILRDWNNADFDAKSILKQLQTKFGVSPFFKVTVETDPTVPGRSSIRISPSGLGLPDREYYYKDQDDRIQTAYKELIRDVVIYLSSTRNEAEKFGNDIFFYEKRIAEITPDRRDLQDPVATGNYRTISELKIRMPTLPLYDILTAMYPESNITETTEVIVTSVDYLTQLAQIIATTDRQTMNGYLIWTLVRNYLPYLSETFISSLSTFQAELFGIRQTLKRWEVCSNLVYNFMGLEIDAITEKNDPITQDTYQVVNETFYSVLKVARNRLNKFKQSPELYKHLKKKLYNLNLQIGLPNQVFNETYLKNYYLRLKIMKSNLFESVKNGITFKKKIEEEFLMKSPPEYAVFRDMLQKVPKVSYLPSSNAIIVPKRLLTSPFFENKYPKSIIYGRLGIEISNAVIDAIFPYNSYWTSDKKLLSQYHMTLGESLKSIEPARYCLSKFILNLNLDVPYKVANETALLTLKHLAAISVANEALTESLTTSPHIHQPSLESYEDSALFFLTYAQTQCSESSVQYQLYDNIVNFKLPHRSMLHMSWSHLRQFPEAYSCSFNKKQQCADKFQFL